MALSVSVGRRRNLGCLFYLEPAVDIPALTLEGARWSGSPNIDCNRQEAHLGLAFKHVLWARVGAGAQGVSCVGLVQPWPHVLLFKVPCLACCLCSGVWLNWMLGIGVYINTWGGCSCTQKPVSDCPYIPIARKLYVCGSVCIAFCECLHHNNIKTRVSDFIC